MSLTTKIISILWWLVAPALVAKLLISLGVLFVADKRVTPLHVEDKKSSSMYSLPKFFSTTLKKKPIQQKVKHTQSLGNLKLKACYIEKGREFVIVNEGAKTLFIDLESSYKGAKLIEIKRNFATFLKDGEYIELTLTGKKTPQKSIKKSKKETVLVDKYINVKRSGFSKYMEDPQKALRDIRFKELKIDKNFAGLKLTFIRKSSFFHKMKLKKGDIIKSVDGNELNSVMDLLPYYNLLKNSTTLLIGVERDGEMKEIIYEIN